MTASRLFTSESVSDGHPDKICDQVSDALLDNLLQRDPDARAGLECLCAKDFMIIAGEMRSREEMDADTIATIARDTIREIGYVFDGFNADTLTIDTRVQPQSLDIALGVDAGSRESEGAGDQGMMFGFACNETNSFMPAAIDISHRIVRRLSERRRAGQLLGLLPDAKSQVTLLYDENGPVRCDTVLVSCHHEERLSTADVTDMLLPEIRAAVPEALLDEDTRFLINPTGRFVIGGPESDTGLTGRKIVVDTYGGSALHGGGAFSGKDPTKVDRSAAYAARYLAKNVVAAGLAARCQIQIAYAIGVPEPVSVSVETQGTAQVDEREIAAALLRLVDLRPRGIIQHLNLARPIYRPTATFGHFGRDPGKGGTFTWEKTDLVDTLRSELA
ncbi:methionine adenosyltransferase (plasmid) [Sulfitobacter sp. LC.270.F.C4]|nr:methionine adenosyltransferase [Sulfitobacter sp. LC.270.F.C4]WOI13480.1 methionine adenosyltransferase [Sulfitobacter sp. LC.270.F.C4]